jgi:SanA protein
MHQKKRMGNGRCKRLISNYSSLVCKLIMRVVGCFLLVCRRMRKWIILGLLIACFIVGNFYNFERIADPLIVRVEDVSKSDAVIVFGALVFQDGQPSDILLDRLNVALEVYRSGKSPKILVSGDHGRVQYDEVNSMRAYLQKQGVPRHAIFMDHAGFDTYNTLYRARDVFGVKSAILVTQRFHLVRALYIARDLGLDSRGIASDTMRYPGMEYYQFRELGARMKALWQASIWGSKPEFLGDTIPIEGDGVLTDDGKS